MTILPKLGGHELGQKKPELKSSGFCNANWSKT